MNTDVVYQKRHHTAERVATEIRKAILHRELLPGEHVRQSWWAQRLGVSSGPTREALKVLVAENLLEYDAHRGYFVARIDPSEMQQIYRIRVLLETEVLASIRWPTASELRQLSETMKSAVDAARRSDGHAALELIRNVAFAIFDLSPLDIIVTETKRYWDRAAVYRALNLATMQNPNARTAKEYYDRLIELLAAQDRQALITFNAEWRTSIPVQVETL